MMSVLGIAAVYRLIRHGDAVMEQLRHPVEGSFYATFPIAMLVMAAVWTIRGVILEEKHLQLQTEIAPDVKLTCDPDKLERVVDNLIRNAISYSYPNTAISLEMHTTEEYAVLTICNTGRTISPEKLDRIFEQFFRGDSSRATATGGAGLGLAIAKQITELHGGTIKADSRNEQIRFTVTLPLRQKIV